MARWEMDLSPGTVRSTAGSFFAGLTVMTVIEEPSPWPSPRGRRDLFAELGGLLEGRLDGWIMEMRFQIGELLDQAIDKQVDGWRVEVADVGVHGRRSHGHARRIPEAAGGDRPSEARKIGGDGANESCGGNKGQM